MVREADGKKKKKKKRTPTPLPFPPWVGVWLVDEGAGWLADWLMNWVFFFLFSCNFTSQALIIIQFIIQSERLTTLLRILTDSPFNSPFDHPSPPPPLYPSPILPYLPEESGMDRWEEPAVSVPFCSAAFWSRERQTYIPPIPALNGLALSSLALSFKRGFSFPGAELHN